VGSAAAGYGNHFVCRAGDAPSGTRIPAAAGSSFQPFHSSPCQGRQPGEHRGRQSFRGRAVSVHKPSRLQSHASSDRGNAGTRSRTSSRLSGSPRKAPTYPPRRQRGPAWRILPLPSGNYASPAHRVFRPSERKRTGCPCSGHRGAPSPLP
jgi:hypothetical protein